MCPDKAYLLVKCPSCGFYNIASARQKTRLCIRCGKTVLIDHFGSRRVESFDDARRLLSELNSRIGTEERSGMQSIHTNFETGKQVKEYTHESAKGLLRTFQEEVLPKFINREVKSSEILDECEKMGFKRDYVEKLLKKLIDGGQAYQPRRDWIRLL
jgi:ribosomal protein S27E/DNA replicative helicase MCM subunit Mcm2 (Cdc46/Mcm family)